MKKVFILLPFFGLFAYFTLSSYSGGPASSGIERTGSTGPTGCGGGGCHGTTGGVAVSIQLLSGTTPVTTYTPGATYTVRLTGTFLGPSTTTTLLSQFGFQLACVRTSTTTNAGAWGVTPPGTHTATVSGINLVEHTSALPVTTGTGAPVSTYVINTPWTAPAAGTGSITFNGVVNAVNGGGSGADANDRSANGSAVITESTSTTGPGPISGTLTVCVGSTTTLTNATTGGTWTSGTTAVATVVSSSGVVTGVAAGTAVVTYSTGTGTPATAVVTVNPAPTPVTGTPTVCIGATTTLNSTPAGGTWVSGTTSVATIGSLTGIVTGVATGTSSVTYVAGGCSVTVTVTVNAAGAAPITGSHTVCVGTTTTLSNLTSGGNWTSSTPSKATVGSATGIVTGVAVGTTMISYTATNSCGSSTVTHSINVLVASACAGAVNTATANDSYLSVFPNPSTGTFTMNMISRIGELANVKVINLSGQIVKEFSIRTNTSMEVSIPRTTGIYFVMALTPSGNYVSKLIVQ